jgi:CubicO group peptidase (beta-lactamase class C family)
MRFGRIFTLGLIVTLPSVAADLHQQKVDQIFAAYDKAGSPGCALGVIQDGNFIYRKGYGMASLELGVPLSPQSVFYMGSVSKQFTAASVVLAAEQGHLSLDDDVRKYIPELPNYGHTITLRQMLHHTSGLRDFETLLGLSGRNILDFHSEDEIMNLIVRQKSLNNVPGEEWIYSNTNYFLLGEVVKRAAKKSLAEFAAEYIFRPLGMAHTRFYDDHSLVIPGRVPGYRGTDGNFRVDWSTNWDVVGAGGLMSSVEDLLLWDRNFYQNRLGKGTLVKELQTPGMLNNGNPIRYALGLELGTYRGLPTVEHAGGFPGYVTDILRFPEQRFTVVCLCNLSSAAPSTLSDKIADIYLSESLSRTEPSTLEPSGGGFPDPSPFAGNYRDMRTHIVYSFTASKGNLMAWGGILRRIGPNQFRDLGSGIITFDDAQGRMKASLEYLGQTFFSGTRIQEPHVSESTLAEFAGLYKSRELDATYRLLLEKGRLVFRNRWNEPVTLTPIAPQEFQSDLGTIVFRRDLNHRVSGLRVFSGNVRNLRFERAN